MGFIKENENFINIELNSRMKNLNPVEEKDRYQEIKLAARNRVSLSYHNSEIQYRFRFYEEAFETLHKFDLFYLLLNLIFDENKKMFLYLSKNTLKKLNVTNENMFESKLIIALKNKEYVNHDFLTDFCKNELTSLLSLNKTDWSDDLTNQNEIVKKFARWIVNVNKNKLDKDTSIYGYILFCYHWSNNALFKEKLELKGIVFYNQLNKEIEMLLKKRIYINLESIINEFKELKKLFFINNEDLLLPFMISNEVTSNRWYLKHKSKFFKYVQQSVEWSQDYSSLSYIQIFEKLHNSTNDVIVEKLKKTIDNKLDVLEIPSDKEINTIENYLLEGNGLKLKNNIYKRLYKY